MSKNSKLRDFYKRNIFFDIGETVYLIRKKKSGHPTKMNFNTEYFLHGMEGEHLRVRKHSLDGIGWSEHHKIHMFYVLPKSHIK